jgi:hypothetical protein
MERLDLAELQVAPEVLRAVPSRIAKYYSILPVKLLPRGDSTERFSPLEIVIGDEKIKRDWDTRYKTELRFMLDRKVVLAYSASSHDVRNAIKRLYN